MKPPKSIDQASKGKKRSESALRETKEQLRLVLESAKDKLERVNAELQAETLKRRRAEDKLGSSPQQLRALSARVQAVREEERKRISREVHDELGQSLTAIKMDLTWVTNRLIGAEEPIRKRIESALRLIDETIQSVRRIAAELRPGVLDDLGLSAAIEWQAQEFQTRTGIICQLLPAPLEDISLDSERATATFRIFQEVLSNIAQHAHATHVQVRLVRSSESVVLRGPG